MRTTQELKPPLTRPVGLRLIHSMLLFAVVFSQLSAPTMAQTAASPSSTATLAWLPLSGPFAFGFVVPLAGFMLG